MRTALSTAGALLCICLLPILAVAQEPIPVSIQVGGSYNVPMGTFADTDGAIYALPTTGFATEGYSFLAKGFLHISPMVAIYASYNLPRFSVDSEKVLENLEFPPEFTYEAEYELRVIGFGGRITPLRIAIAVPYIQAGVAQYDIDIIQYISGSKRLMESERATSFNFGAGVTAMIGSVGLDLGVEYNSTEILFDGQSLEYEATWVGVGLSLIYRLGG